MTQSHQDPDTELPLSSAVFHILLALADGECHGYGIMQEVKIRTEDRVHLGPGTLYGAIKRLLDKRLIEEAEERTDPELNDERRRYYRLTEFGLRVLRAEAARLARLVRQAEAKQLLPDWSSGPITGGK